MKKIKVSVSTRYVGSESVDYVEVEDDATEEEINDIAFMAMNEMIDYHWEEVEGE